MPDHTDGSTTAEDVLAGLEPEAFWRGFEALTKIARPSGHEWLLSGAKLASRKVA